MRVMIREAKKEDLKKIYELDFDFLNYEAKIDSSLKRVNKEIRKYEIEFINKKFKSRDAKIFIASLDSKLIGYCYGSIWKLDPNHKISPEGYLCNCFVSEKYRNKRVGKKLVEALIAWLKKKGAKRISLDITEKNKNGIRFWKKLGFKPHPWKRMCLEI